MALRDWKPRTIRRLWAAGILADCLIVLAMYASRGTPPRRLRHFPPDSSIVLAGPAADSLRREIYQHLHDSLGITVSTVGDTLTTFTKDSLSLTLHSRSDTVRSVDLSPAAQRQVAAVFTPIARALSDAMPAFIRFVLIMLAITLLPIPLTLTIITLLWWRARRRDPISART